MTVVMAQPGENSLIMTLFEQGKVLAKEEYQMPDGIGLTN